MKKGRHGNFRSWRTLVNATPVDRERSRYLPHETRKTAIPLTCANITHNVV
jgi:hypothetical protein